MEKYAIDRLVEFNALAISLASPDTAARNFRLREPSIVRECRLRGKAAARREFSGRSKKPCL
jgi:hypothetical protein